MRPEEIPASFFAAIPEVLKNQTPSCNLLAIKSINFKVKRKN